MKTITESVINKPIDRVFDYMMNLDNAREWVTELVDVTYDGDLRLGATGIDVRRAGRRTIEMPWEVIEFDSPRRVVFRYSTPFEATARFEFAESGPGTTRVRCVSDLRPTGWWRLMAPMLRREARRTDAAQFAKAKVLLESDALPGP